MKDGMKEFLILTLVFLAILALIVVATLYSSGPKSTPVEKNLNGWLLSSEATAPTAVEAALKGEFIHAKGDVDDQYKGSIRIGDTTFFDNSPFYAQFFDKDEEYVCVSGDGYTVIINQELSYIAMTYQLDESGVIMSREGTKNYLFLTQAGGQTAEQALASLAAIVEQYPSWAASFAWALAE